MGSSSKVILVGATSLIVGVYAISLKKAEADGVGAAMKYVNRVQNERVEDAALRAAMGPFVKSNGVNDRSGTMEALDGGTFTYSIVKRPVSRYSLPSCDLTVTITREGVTKTITAWVKKDRTTKDGARKIRRGEWEVKSRFVSIH